MMKISIFLEMPESIKEEAEMSVVEELTRIGRTINLFAFYLKGLFVLGPAEVLELEATISHLRPEINGTVSILVGSRGCLGGVAYEQRYELRFNQTGFYLQNFGGRKYLTAYAAASLAHKELRERLKKAFSNLIA